MAKPPEISAAEKWFTEPNIRRDENVHRDKRVKLKTHSSAESSQSTRIGQLIIDELMNGDIGRPACSLTIKYFAMGYGQPVHSKVKFALFYLCRNLKVSSEVGSLVDDVLEI